MTYVAVDGGMSDNPRPVLYGARYQAWIADRAGEEPDADVRRRRASTASPGDVLIEEARLPAPRPGDVLAVAATGAYSASMASNYNGLPRPAAVVVARRRGPHRSSVARRWPTCCVRKSAEVRGPRGRYEG